jgi:hypothetical protein
LAAFQAEAEKQLLQELRVLGYVESNAAKK